MIPMGKGSSGGYRGITQTGWIPQRDEWRQDKIITPEGSRHDFAKITNKICQKYSQKD